MTSRLNRLNSMPSQLCHAITRSRNTSQLCGSALLSSDFMINLDSLAHRLMRREHIIVGMTTPMFRACSPFSACLSLAPQAANPCAKLEQPIAFNWCLLFAYFQCAPNRPGVTSTTSHGYGPRPFECLGSKTLSWRPVHLDIRMGII